MWVGVFHSMKWRVVLRCSRVCQKPSFSDIFRYEHLEQGRHFMWIMDTVQMGVSKNNGTPKSSTFLGFSIISHPFGVPLFLETPKYNTWILFKSSFHPIRLRPLSEIFDRLGAGKDPLKFKPAKRQEPVEIFEHQPVHKGGWNTRMGQLGICFYMVLYDYILYDYILYDYIMVI